jgi:hypothetical protein
MNVEKTGVFLDVVDHLNKQNLKMMVIRDTMACQEENEGWFWIIDDMMREGEEMRDKVSLFYLRIPDEGPGHEKDHS